MSNDNWTTPKWLFNYLDRRFDFKLDAAASAENHLVPFFYTEESNGLDSPWSSDGWTFCNPPYSNVAEWVRKAAKELTLHNRRSLLLVPVRSDQAWWHEYAISGIAAIEWYQGRISFGESTGSAWMYSINLIFGAKPGEIVNSIDLRNLDPRPKKRTRKTKEPS
jgi:phage N-6-adenine-methyltransferase